MFRYYADNLYICMIFNVDEDLNSDVLKEFYNNGFPITMNNYRDIFEMYTTKYYDYLKYCTYELYKVEIDECNGRYVLENNSQDSVYETGIQCIDCNNRAIMLKNMYDNYFHYCIPDSNYDYKLRINIDKQSLMNTGINECNYVIFEKLTNLISSLFVETNFKYCMNLFCLHDNDLIINTAQKHCILIKSNSSGCIYHSNNFLHVKRTNIKCVNCVDCYDCKSCIDCRNCKTCEQCNYCSNCVNCSNCDDKHLH